MWVKFSRYLLNGKGCSLLQWSVLWIECASPNLRLLLLFLHSLTLLQSCRDESPDFHLYSWCKSLCEHCLYLPWETLHCTLAFILSLNDMNFILSCNAAILFMKHVSCVPSQSILQFSKWDGDYSWVLWLLLSLLYPMSSRYLNRSRGGRVQSFRTIHGQSCG